MNKYGFHLTRQASRTLRDIYANSRKQWGAETADRYLADLYAAMKKAAAKPEIGQLRAARATPFLMVPAGRHFMIYDRVERGIVILTLLHQRRDIEQIIADLGPTFQDEIRALGFR